METLGTSNVFKRAMPGVAETFILQDRECKWVDPDPTSEGVSRSAPGFDVRVGWIGRCSAASLITPDPIVMVQSEGREVIRGDLCPFIGAVLANGMSLVGSELEEVDAHLE